MSSEQEFTIEDIAFEVAATSMPQQATLIVAMTSENSKGEEVTEQKKVRIIIVPEDITEVPFGFGEEGELQ